MRILYYDLQILFRVGEIVFHREYEVRGVVLGWDREARAPLSWLRQVYSEQQTSLYTEPHYTVICDVNQVRLQQSVRLLRNIF